MKRRNTSTRKTAQGFVESIWNPLLTAQLDMRWARRAKSAIKQGDVVRVTVKDGMMHAEVKQSNFGRGMYQVQIPCVAWWEPHLEEVARWLSRRMDWLATLLAGEWADEFVDTAAVAGLRLLPEEADVDRILSECRCSCTDVEHPCRHVLCVLYWMIGQMDASPLSALLYVGLPEDALLSAVHAETRAQVHALDMDAGLDLSSGAWAGVGGAVGAGAGGSGSVASDASVEDAAGGAGTEGADGVGAVGGVGARVASGSAWNSWTPEEAQVFSSSNAPVEGDEVAGSASSQAKPIRPVLDKRKIAVWL